MDPRHLIVTAGGLGFMPIASGTWGTLAGVALVYVLPADSFALWLAIAFVAVSILNILLCPWAERTYGKKDPGQFVIDEVAGYCVTVAALAKPDLVTLIVAFFVFRLFDILKPWPGRAAEHLPAGWGIWLDDVIAGVYGFALLTLLRLAGVI